MKARRPRWFDGRDGFLVEPHHAPTCYLARSGRDEFIVYDGWVNRRRNGDRGGSTWFHCFRCNDAKCDARLLVRWDVLANLLVPGSGK